MSDTKALPSDLKQIEKLPRFVRVYKDNTVDGLEEKLTVLEVKYLSADNKAELTWRYMDAKGMDFSDPKKDRDAIQTTTNDKADSDEATEVVQAGDDKTISNVNGGDEPVSNDVKPVSNVDQKAEVDKPGTSDSDNDNQSNPIASAGTPPTANSGDKRSSNEAEQPSKAANKPAATSTTPGSQTDANQAVNEPMNIAVRNIGDFAVYEPASRTMLPAGETTKIFLSGRVTHDAVTKNIEQYNKSRGKKLIVIN